MMVMMMMMMVVMATTTMSYYEEGEVDEKSVCDGTDGSFVLLSTLAYW